jgi:hypothetical protein
MPKNLTAERAQKNHPVEGEPSTLDGLNWELTEGKPSTSTKPGERLIPQWLLLSIATSA